MGTQSYIRPDVFGANGYDPMKEPRYPGIATFMRAPLWRALSEVAPHWWARLHHV
jgi:hypothetical protein